MSHLWLGLQGEWLHRLRCRGSVHEHHLDWHEALDVGGQSDVEFLPKPYLPDELARRIRQLLDRRA